MKILLHGISEIFLPVFSSRTLWCCELYLVLYPSCVYFCVWCKLLVEFHFFACSCPDLPTPFVEEAVFIPFYPSSLFVKY